jgi:hypothetical protein
MCKKAFLVLALGLVVGLRSPPAAWAEVNINVNVGPPPVVLVSPPRLVVVPGSPVSYAPEVNFNVFVLGGRYYTFHEGVWFHAATHRGPWAAIVVEQVPPPVLAVPVKYYKIPPGHAKKMGGGPGKCPPGLGKQGRC